MKTIFSKALFTLLSMLLCANLYSQNIENRAIKENPSEYNLPPGVVFGKKFGLAVDLVIFRYLNDYFRTTLQLKNYQIQYIDKVIIYGLNLNLYLC